MKKLLLIALVVIVTACEKENETINTCTLFIASTQQRITANDKGEFTVNGVSHKMLSESLTTFKDLMMRLDKVELNKLYTSTLNTPIGYSIDIDYNGRKRTTQAANDAIIPKDLQNMYFFLKAISYTN